MRPFPLLRALTVVLAGAVLGPVHSIAQEGPYADEAARRLHEAALANRARRDHSVVQYTALVRQRIGAGLRLPLKDRTLYRAESAHRVFWDRSGDMLVQVLALREQTPLGVQEESTKLGLFDAAFDPANDRLFFGFVEPDEDMGDPDEDFWFEHPLVPEYRDHYRFTVGDTLTVSLPDGRRIQAVELQVVPTVVDVHRMSGSLWIEPEEGALVRAVYRLSDTFDAIRDIPDLKQEEEQGEFRFVPGLFKPWTFEMSLIAVDYVLWDFDVWLPRSLRMEGVASAGILKAPASMDLSYEIEEVVTEADLLAEADEPLEERHFATRREAMEELARVTGMEDVPYVLEPGWTSYRDGRYRRTLRYLVPEDPAFLRDSPYLPPPVWEDAPGFASREELEGLFENLADLPEAPLEGIPRTFRWGPQRPDLMRYNRVEALSVGARGQVLIPSHWGPLSVSGTVRLGAADLEPNARLDVTRESLRRRVTWSVFHELAAVDPEARHLGLGNSVTAAFFGRDDGEYYRRSGASLEWTPPAAERRSFSVLAYAEYHRTARAETDFSLRRIGDGDWLFRDNLVADEGWEMGGLVTLSPWWGSDPRSAQGGLRMTLHGAGGDREFARAAAVGTVVFPFPSDLRLALEAGGGATWGAAPAQRGWILGGATTLRGYGPRALEGPTFLRGRGELAKHFAFGAVSVFSDVAWAGERDAIRLDDALYSVGTGLSLVDGLIRLDAAWGLRAPETFRLELYLDGIL